MLLRLSGRTGIRATEAAGRAAAAAAAPVSRMRRRRGRRSRTAEDYNIEYIEQPLPKNELEDLSELRNHTQIPIAVDESLTSIESAKKIIEYQAADIFVLKPMLMGSYQSCIDIIKCGEENRIKTVITTTIGTEIERYSCIQIAFATDIKLACGLSTTSFLRRCLKLAVFQKTTKIDLGFF